MSFHPIPTAVLYCTTRGGGWGCVLAIDVAAPAAAPRREGEGVARLPPPPPPPPPLSSLPPRPLPSLPPRPSSRPPPRWRARHRRRHRRHRRTAEKIVAAMRPPRRHRRRRGRRGVAARPPPPPHPPLRGTGGGPPRRAPARHRRRRRLLCPRRPPAVRPQLVGPSAVVRSTALTSRTMQRGPQPQDGRGSLARRVEPSVAAQGVAGPEWTSTSRRGKYAFA